MDGQIDLFSMLGTEKQEEKETEKIEPDKPAQVINLFDFFQQASVEKVDNSSSIVHQAEKINFRITDDRLGTGNAMTKYRYNAEALRLLKKIEAEGRLASSDEQEILSRYVGWGALPAAFDEKDKEWQEPYAELKELLSDEEYSSAKESILSAYYTPPMIIRAIYQALEKFGFKQGNILEPACGIGHFFGMLPESMEKSRLYGVEIDSLSSRIARQLYQTANITIQGFEAAKYPDNFFDVVCGNVPFGSYKVLERRYDKYNFMIHDFFLAKALDMVRPGGIVALVTYKGTLDKENKSIRTYLAMRADLIGAIRLPNNAFAANAGTYVTADILFFQKREHMGEADADWLELGTVGDGIPVNAYFSRCPEMMLGHMEFDTRYGEKSETKLLPYKDANLEDQLRTAVNNLDAQITECSPQPEDPAETDILPADSAVKNFSYTLIDGKLYYRENSVMLLQKRSGLINRRIRGMVKLREAVREVIQTQMLDICNEEVLIQARATLNDEYERFVRQFGSINSRANNLAFRHEADYPLLSSLEIIQEDGSIKKADMFYKRTIRQKKIITHVDTSVEALAVCLNEIGHVDISFMAGLTGGKPLEVIQKLQNVIYQDPAFWGEDEYQGWEPADQYLSGNVRQKLKDAKSAAHKYPSRFELNVQALENVQPEDIEAADIDLRLGAIWINPKYIKQFIFHLLKPPKEVQKSIDVGFSKYNCTWHLDGKSADSRSVRAKETYGTSRINAYEIIERTLNLKEVKVFDKDKNADGNVIYVLNRAETIAAQEKQSVIKDEFKQWIFFDQARRNDLVKTYNEQFNSIRLREFDGSHLTFPGMSPDIELRTHQASSVARILYGGNTLLAQVVGSGKTFEMVAAAMELKRLGIANKSLFIVPNYLVGEWGAEFLRLYPSANILLAEKEDFEKSKRQRFCGKIATGDYDAVIMGHSSFEKIPISGKRAAVILLKEISEVQDAIKDAKEAHGENYTVKQMLATQKKLESRLQGLENREQQDDVVDFEQLGVDMLFVDEADNFKNLFLHTKMRNVAGISQSEAKKSTDLYIKCQFLNELTHNKGIVFATGTPVSNSMVELYTLQRYLQPDELARMGLDEFDCWA
jgi:N12 class adenine-specific DNA methylase